MAATVTDTLFDDVLQPLLNFVGIIYVSMPDKCNFPHTTAPYFCGYDTYENKMPPPNESGKYRTYHPFERQPRSQQMKYHEKNVMQHSNCKHEQYESTCALLCAYVLYMILHLLKYICCELCHRTALFRVGYYILSFFRGKVKFIKGQ